MNDFERSLHQKLPNITLAIDDLWVQGYKLGKAHLDMQRQGDRLEWRELSLSAAAAKSVHRAVGYWLEIKIKHQCNFHCQVKITVK
ncbi:hypothetical protein [Vibrio taketomensis]